jgi:RNA polymerase sigma-70 factor, ECF subfamily
MARAYDDERTERRLIARSRLGDLDAFAGLYHRYRPEILKYASRRLGDPMLAEDAVQETFLAAYTYLHTFDRNRRFLPWLWTIASHATERIGRCAAYEPVIIEREPECEPAEDSALASIEFRRLLAAIHSLPDRRKRAILLHDLAGWSTAELARHEGTSELAIRSILCRARASVRERLAAGLAVVFGLVRRARRRVDRTAARVENIEAAAGSYAGVQVVLNVVCAIAVVLGPVASSAATALHAPTGHSVSLSAPLSPQGRATFVPPGGVATLGRIGSENVRIGFRSPPKQSGRVVPPGGQMDIAVVGPDGSALAGAHTWLECTGELSELLPQDGPVTGLC